METETSADDSAADADSAQREPNQLAALCLPSDFCVSGLVTAGCPDVASVHRPLPDSTTPASQQNKLTVKDSLAPQSTFLSAVVASGCGNLQQHQYFSPFSSTQSSILPTCRICQCFSGSVDATPVSSGIATSASTATVAASTQPLISPCRCTGSLLFVHPQCLRKWIEVCQKTKWADNSGQPPACELCGYTYRMRTYLEFRSWRCPSVTVSDKFLHAAFFTCLLVMVACAVTMVLCFVTNASALGFTSIREKDELSLEEIISLSCGIGFFASFFVAMAAEIKAEHTIFHVCRKCVQHNTVWFLDNYSAGPADMHGRCTGKGALV